MRSEEPGGPERGLARFHPAPRPEWTDVPSSRWNDWRWQFRNRLTRVEDLEKRLSLTPSERQGLANATHRLSLGITPFFFSLIDRADPNCPIRRQVVPTAEEGATGSEEMVDPVGEDADSPVPGLVHRYPDRVLLLVNDRCASYCRYCTRSRLVGDAVEGGHSLQLSKVLDYLRMHTEVRDVLLSGGDPLLLGDGKLDELLGSLRAIPHLEFLRIGTRLPVVMPQRITTSLCRVLRRHHPLWVSIQANHPRELTREAHDALTRLADAGIPLGSQTVLLKGINDDPRVMRDLVHKLLLCRVRPYYLYQCDLIRGSRHFRVPVGRALEIVEKLRGFTTGYAVPQFVIDAPGGGGKVPLNPDYVIYRDAERVVFRNYRGKVFEYPEPASPCRKKTAVPRLCEVESCPLETETRT